MGGEGTYVGEIEEGTSCIPLHFDVNGMTETQQGRDSSFTDYVHLVGL